MKWLLVGIGAFFDGFQLMVGLFFIVLAFVPGIDFVTLPVGGAIDFAISVIAGIILVILLLINKMFYPTIFLGALGIEAIPFVNIIPGWTGLALASAMRKQKEEGREQAQQNPSEEEGEEEPNPESFRADIVRQFNGSRPPANENVKMAQ